MNKHLSTMLVLCLCFMFMFAGVAEAVAAPSDGKYFETAIVISELDTAYEVTIPSTSLDDNKYFQYTPPESSTYTVSVKPSLEYIWVQMYSAADLQHVVECQSVWLDSIQDFALAYDLVAGQTYYFQVGGNTGIWDGSIAVGRLDGDNAPETTEEASEEEIDVSVFQNALQLTQAGMEYQWTITNELWSEDGEIVAFFEEKFYKVIPAETAVYKIVSKPSLYDSYLVLYAVDDTGKVQEVDLPWGEVERESVDGSVIFDYVIETELTAGETHYIRLASMEGGTGTLVVTGGGLESYEESSDEAASNEGDADEQPASKPLTTNVGIPGYSIDGVAKDMPACYYKGQDTFMPIRMLQDLGVTFDWDAAAQTATMTRGTETVKVTIGSTDAYVNGVKTSIVGASGALLAPELAEGRTMIPLRFVNEKLGFNVQWNHPNLITITLT